MSNDIETFKVGYLNVRIQRDEHAQSPREDDNLGLMVCFHRRYKLGDEHAFSHPNAFRVVHDEKTAVILPLYLYDHSGITMNTTGFSCEWDSSQVGWICASLEDIRLEYDVQRVSKKLREKVRQRLIQEVETYDLWLRGEFTGFVVEDEEGITIDSCWGFDDPEYCAKEARNAAEYAMGERAKAEMAEAL